MDLVERISSLVTLLSLFIVAPALGRAVLLWWDERTQRSLPSQHIALTVSTMIALTALIAVYGVVWKANPRLIAWYAWISPEIPIEGNVGWLFNLVERRTDLIRAKVTPTECCVDSGVITTPFTLYLLE
jgi:hypothetical protein